MRMCMWFVMMGSLVIILLRFIGILCFQDFCEVCPAMSDCNFFYLCFVINIYFVIFIAFMTLLLRLLLHGFWKRYPSDTSQDIQLITALMAKILK